MHLRALCYPFACPNRQELQDTAAWLLLHHAQHKPADIVSGGAASTCLAGIQDAALAPACRGAMAALLAMLVLADGQREFVLRLRSGGRSAVHILLSAALQHGLAVAIRDNASAALAALTEEPEHAQVRLHALHGAVWHVQKSASPPIWLQHHLWAQVAQVIHTEQLSVGGGVAAACAAGAME